MLSSIHRLTLIGVLCSVLCGVVFNSVQTQAQSAQSEPAARPTMFAVGEVLEYRVSYAGLTIGTIKMLTEKRDTLRGQSIVKMKAFIDTAPGIPFVEFHAIYESWADKSGMFSHEFLASNKITGSEDWDYDRYQFLYPQSRINVTSNAKGKQPFAALQSQKRWNDGLSLFFTAREMLNLFQNASQQNASQQSASPTAPVARRNVGIPTMVMGDTSWTIINYKDAQTQTIESPLAKQPIRVVYFNGEAKWRGIYGLAGDFEGWFSDDEARVPIRAKMKVIIGKVNIELVRWRRTGWQPPLAQ
jgi:hypothetical protein